MPQKYAAGNWKMNGLVSDLTEVLEIDKGVQDLACNTVICLPATLIYAADGDPRQVVEIGGQYCHPSASGAHTGDISAEMLSEAGAAFVVTGHSERRTDHGETDADVRAQTEAAWRAGLVAILCIGETLAQREAGETLSVLAGQLKGSLPDGATPENTIIAYEPVWAIGTGKVATPEQVAEVHDALRAQVDPEMSLLYGGSVKAANAAELFALTNVDGALVGGASLKAVDFVPIARALAAS
ncbi:triosephosphate isomerase [Jannaschia pagri]|uniref:Triosephosphate isomerase n=1 Tax=Jannaschia pagri TaxID=2829797 RepID=A0ABQ4NPE0_9RHOB|nr:MULTISPECIES: triose-phosphate isomerase [unclassified Jannaschia]GIT92429.1 triosephosphate isomerase [Jannaschia sp. AI_61]GIT96264.1 triosephosphate isomerase [Jannaschia sp. AI_62]